VWEGEADFDKGGEISDYVDGDTFSTISLMKFYIHSDSVAPMIHEDFPGVGQYHQPPVERSRRGSFNRAPRKSIGTYVVCSQCAGWCAYVYRHIHRA
jgi:hypothetical protein